MEMNARVLLLGARIGFWRRRRWLRHREVEIGEWGFLTFGLGDGERVEDGREGRCRAVMRHRCRGRRRIDNHYYGSLIPFMVVTLSDSHAAVSLTGPRRLLPLLQWCARGPCLAACSLLVGESGSVALGWCFRQTRADAKAWGLPHNLPPYVASR